MWKFQALYSIDELTNHWERFLVVRTLKSFTQKVVEITNVGQQMRRGRNSNDASCSVDLLNVPLHLGISQRVSFFFKIGFDVVQPNSRVLTVVEVELTIFITSFWLPSTLLLVNNNSLSNLSSQVLFRAAYVVHAEASDRHKSKES